MSFFYEMSFIHDMSICNAFFVNDLHSKMSRKSPQPPLRWIGGCFFLATWTLMKSCEGNSLPLFNSFDWSNSNIWRILAKSQPPRVNYNIILYDYIIIIKIFVKNGNFRHKSKFSSKIEIFVKNRNYHQKSKFSS